MNFSNKFVVETDAEFNGPIVADEVVVINKSRTFLTLFLLRTKKKFLCVATSKLINFLKEENFVFLSKLR